MLKVAPAHAAPPVGGFRELDGIGSLCRTFDDDGVLAVPGGEQLRRAAPQAAAQEVAPYRDRARRSPVSGWAEAGRSRTSGQRRAEPVEHGQGPHVSRCARARRRGRGRAPGVIAHRAVRPLAPRSRPRSCTYAARRACPIELKSSVSEAPAPILESVPVSGSSRPARSTSQAGEPLPSVFRSPPSRPARSRRPRRAAAGGARNRRDSAAVDTVMPTAITASGYEVDGVALKRGSSLSQFATR
jgi:hypothetical protein